MSLTRPKPDETIRDFGAQWTRFRANEGYYASAEIFSDICGPLLPVAEFAGASVADLGSGTGRVVAMLIEAGAAEVTAVEPSAAYEVLRHNLDGARDKVRFVQAKGDQLEGGPFDLVVALGVLHHIPEPAPVVRRAFERLKPGGRILVWLYGREGNRLYLAFAEPLRWVTTRLPDRLLAPLAMALTAVLSAYCGACRFLPLPMRAYMRAIIGRYDWRYRYLTVFDQLNPQFSKYYRRGEVEALLAEAGFTDVRLHHRHGYSWTAIGRKPG
ncbi:Ubiquinone/menaquinone biosynthesis C-methylase UbiE [Tistlia consotensis]|uniref:Ubiquinone/menaquinone biosynthesis C-methylase UbiE n=1 Tax=Tistlia consotensis USBA 355 TaxID=560819 RepID=A0A1Y6BB96_9PROT|nr:class I SAM-dependent methyltransferase [Tistlia consotensis]SME98895.1 Ubiquinone/menaquinone biosynthesis C-methylase UbiE [Tistlia consotensis USBA 355]SNR58360.1 Ubiquinone/menaquinone biosynthesis C-methylase UbiE [Tistlia consotensis]